MRFDYPKMNNWELSNGYSLNGIIYNSKNGKTIVTASKVTRFIAEQDIVIAETHNSRYILDKNKHKRKDIDVWNSLISMIEGE